MNKSIWLALAASLTALAQPQTPAGVPAEIIVTVGHYYGPETPALTQESLTLTQHYEPLAITNLIPLRGDRAGLELFLLVDNCSSCEPGTKFEELRRFIVSQPATTSIGVAYIRNGNLEVAENPRRDREHAVAALNVPEGNKPSNPYDAVTALIKSWGTSPSRHAILMISNGINPAGPEGGQDPSVEAAIAAAQRARVTVYAMYHPRNPQTRLQAAGQRQGEIHRLLVGITFAVFLMIAMTSLFAGVLNRASATVINLGASVWVMDPSVQTVANTIGMPDYVLDAARSMDGVNYAVPVYSGGALVKLADGNYQSVNCRRAGRYQPVRPAAAHSGKDRGHLRRERFHCRQRYRVSKMGNPRIGTEFELNDHRGVIVGIATVASSGLFGVPTLYTTYERALQYIPNPRFTISYVLVKPKSPADIPRIKRQVQALGYLALTKDEFMDKISEFYMFQTGLGMNLLIMTVMSFIVGLSISGQTFYTFILENLEKFGALKAIGAKSRELILMILFQASFTALTGYGLGVGLCALVIYIAKLRIARLCGHDHLVESRTCFRDGRYYRGRFQLCRGPQGIARRTIRHLQRMT
jgi:putative ABC transport system permease protein